MTRIYVASLSDYNAGRLHGVWIDCAGKDGNEIQAEVNKMLDASKEPYAEEWAIHDHEGFGGMLGESTGFDEVAELADLIEQYGAAFIAYAENIGDGATASGFTDAYQGQFDTATAWAEQHLEDTGALDAIPEEFRNYFDYESWARDAQTGGMIWRSHDGHTFWNN